MRSQFEPTFDRAEQCLLSRTRESSAADDHVVCDESDVPGRRISNRQSRLTEWRARHQANETQAVSLEAKSPCRKCVPTQRCASRGGNGDESLGGSGVWAT